MGGSAVTGGSAATVDATFAALYQELRRIARRELRREAARRTLQTTALVHEAYLKLQAQRAFAFQDETHFLALAARAMRQVLIDCARKRNAARRSPRVDLDAMLEGARCISPDDFLFLNDALERLSVRSPKGSRQVRLIELV
jgi:RNA polymerase sigma factor (TIGR02999 family)